MRETSPGKVAQTWNSPGQIPILPSGALTFRFALLLAVTLLLALRGASLLAAQPKPMGTMAKGECQMEPDWNVAQGTAHVMPGQFEGVGISQRLNYQIPLNLVFRNSRGQRVHLGRYFGKKPVILSLVYFNCPMLCTLEEHGLLDALKVMKYTVGKQFDVVTVSFDPHDTPAIAARKKSYYLSLYKRPAAGKGWHFLTGGKASIDALTEAVGFHYRYDPQTHMYAHAVAIMVLTPDGKLAQYFYGINYPAGNLRLAVVQASQGKVGSPVDEMLLYCYRYNPVSGKYSVVISHVLMLGGGATVLMIVGLVLILTFGGRQQSTA